MTRANLSTIIERWVPDTTSGERNTAITDALHSLQRQLGLGSEVSSDIAVSAGAASVAIPATFLTVETAIWNPASDYRELEPVKYHVLVTKYRSSNQDQAGEPGVFASTGSTLYLWEKPISAGTLRLVGLGAFEAAHDLDADGDTVHPVFSEPDIIAFKAIINLLAQRRQITTVFREVLPVFNAKLRLVQGSRETVTGVHAPDVEPSRYDFSDY